MRGAVKFFNVGKGLGFVSGEDGTEYFVHHSQLMMSGLRFLVAGQRVEFTPAQDAQGRLQAHCVLSLAAPKGVIRRDELPELTLVGEERAAVRVDALGRVCAIDGRPVSAHVEVDGAFRAYRTGPRHLRGCELRLPASTAEVGFVLLDNEKNPRRETRPGVYNNAESGSYVVVVHRGGRVTVWSLARRIQDTVDGRRDERAALHWLVVERRFDYQYDFDGDLTEQRLRAATTTSGLDRDNDGFIPAILRGIEAMRAAAKAAAPAPATASPAP